MSSSNSMFPRVSRGGRSLSGLHVCSRLGRWLLATSLIACAMSVPAAAQPQPQPQPQPPAGRVIRSAVVTAVDAPIALDGVLDEPIWSTAPAIGALVQRQPRQGAEPTRTHRRHAPLQRHAPLHRRARARRRTRARHRHADGPRRKYRGGRSHRDPPRHVPRSAQRLLLRHQSLRRARRRPRRQRSVERRLGRDLGRPHAPHRCRAGARSSRFRSRASASRPAPRHWGFNITRTHPSQARRSPMVGRAARHAVLPGLGGRRDHPARRSLARHRPRRPSVPRGPHAEARRRQRHGREAGARRLLQHHAQPEADHDLQHRLRRNGSRRAPDQPDPLFGAVSGEAIVLPRRRRRLQLREHRPRTGGRHPAGGRRCVSVLQPSDWIARRTGSAARCRRQADRARSDAPTSGCSPSAPAISRYRQRPAPRRGRRSHRRSQDALRRPREAEPVAAVVRRRDLHQRPSGARPVGTDLRRGSAARHVALPGPAAQHGVQRVRGPLREQGRVGRRLVVRVRARLSQRQVRRAALDAHDREELRAGARVRAARQRADGPGGGQLQPAPEDTS